MAILKDIKECHSWRDKGSPVAATCWDEVVCMYEGRMIVDGGCGLYV